MTLNATSLGYSSLVGVVSHSTGIAVIPSVGSFSPPSSAAYLGKLVVDSLLALPGNTVHLSGGDGGWGFEYW